MLCSQKIDVKIRSILGTVSLLFTNHSITEVSKGVLVLFVNIGAQEKKVNKIKNKINFLLFGFKIFLFLIKIIPKTIRISKNINSVLMPNIKVSQRGHKTIIKKLILLHLNKFLKKKIGGIFYNLSNLNRAVTKSTNAVQYNLFQVFILF